MSCGLHAGTLERARRGVAEADAERVGAVGDVVGGVGVAFGAGEDDRGRVREVARMLGRRHDRRPPRSRSRRSSRAVRNGSLTHGDAR